MTATFNNYIITVYINDKLVTTIIHSSLSCIDISSPAFTLIRLIPYSFTYYRTLNTQPSLKRCHFYKFLTESVWQVKAFHGDDCVTDGGRELGKRARYLVATPPFTTGWRNGIRQANILKEHLRINLTHSEIFFFGWKVVCPYEREREKGLETFSFLKVRNGCSGWAGRRKDVRTDNVYRQFL